MKIKNQGLNKILDEIIERKKQDLALQKKEIPLIKLKDFVSNLGPGQSRFKEAILKSKDIALIAEIKLASPTDQSLNPNIDIMGRAGDYEKAGANALSYITEKNFFKGEISGVIKICAKVDLPVLQKDFVIDEYQIYEARIVGSSALLLIAGLFDGKKLKKYVALCKALQVEPVVEINNEEDLEKAMNAKTAIIAVNARDLNTFEIDVKKACKLMKKIPDNFMKLGFSGINSSVEVKKYKESGAKGVLVGTSLMKAKNIYEFIKELKQV